MGQVRLAIGPRSALFAPFTDIGLIVLDEEHDASYKQSDRMPTYHARDVALRIASAHGATVILGSATPDLGTYYLARETSSVALLELPQRILKHRRQVEEAKLQPQLLGYQPLSASHQDVYAIGMPPVRVIFAGPLSARDSEMVAISTTAGSTRLKSSVRSWDSAVVVAASTRRLTAVSTGRFIGGAPRLPRRRRTSSSPGPDVPSASP